MFNKILFPLDRSREAQEAVAVTIGLVKKYQSKLTLLSVIETPDLDAEVLDDPVMQSPDAVDRLLHTAKDLFGKQGIQADILQREGKPAFTICDVADELDVDLIIMGSRGDLEHPADSVASRVINLSPCPVLIVP
jgi:nucleotide-binding universal stress UspA family protein